jgi:hypothetical protein
VRRKLIGASISIGDFDEKISVEGLTENVLSLFRN